MPLDKEALVSRCDYSGFSLSRPQTALGAGEKRVGSCPSSQLPTMETTTKALVRLSVGRPLVGLSVILPQL